MTRDQSDFLASLGFKVYDDKVSELEDEQTTPCMIKEDIPEHRHKVLAIEWTSGLIPLTFASGKLGFSGKSLIVSADQELITCMPRLKLDLEFIGSPIERIKSLSQDRIAYTRTSYRSSSPTLQIELLQGGITATNNRMKYDGHELRP